jgi:hypothetical protein
VFNFTVNNGIDKQGNVVLIDFNETSRSKVKALECIKTGRWLKSMSYLTLDPQLKEYYKKAMEQGITESQLEEYWQ